MVDFLILVIEHQSNQENKNVKKDEILEDLTTSRLLLNAFQKDPVEKQVQNCNLKVYNLKNWKSGKS